MRQLLKPETHNILHEPLVELNKIILPVHHVKSGFMKNFVKMMDKTQESFLYVSTKFPHLSKATIKDSILVGSQRCKLFKDEHSLKMNIIKIYSQK